MILATILLRFAYNLLDSLSSCGLCGHLEVFMPNLCRVCIHRCREGVQWVQVDPQGKNWKIWGL